MILPATIEKVLSLPIIDVVEKYHEPTKKSGANHVCHCPFPGHKDTHASFMVSPNKNIARCFVCSKTVNTIGFVMELKALNYPDAIRQLATDFDIKIEESIIKKEVTDEEKLKIKEQESMIIATQQAADWYHNQLLSALEKHYPQNDYYSYYYSDGDFSFLDKNKPQPEKEEYRIISYILHRFHGSVELIKKFKIGYAPSGYDNLFSAMKLQQFSVDVLVKAGLVKAKENNAGFLDAFLFRPLIFPVHNLRGSIVGFAARKMPWDKSVDKTGKPYPKFINTAETSIYNKSKLLYGFDNDTRTAITKADKCYIVEGNTDKTSLFFINIKNAVAKSGTALTDEQIENLKKLTKNICLVDDGDAPGQKSMLQNGEKLTLANCNVTILTLPDGEDPDTFFKDEKQFRDFEKENERDYIIDIRAVHDLEAATTIQLKKKVKQAVADLLIQKPKDERNDYIKQIVKNSDTTRDEWNEFINKAIFKSRNKGLNISEETEEKEAIQADNSEDNKHKHNFYYIKRDKQDKFAGIEIDERKFLLKLKSTQEWEFEYNGKTKSIYFGFYTYFLNPDESDLIFVQLKHGRIKKVSVNLIKKTFFQYVRLLKPYEYNGVDSKGWEWTETITSKKIETILLKKITVLFEEKRLVLFPDKEIKLLQDTLDKHYTFFRNCFIISSANGYSVHNYEELKDGYVWDDAVLERNFNEPADTAPGVFEKFVCDISGNEWNVKEDLSHYQERTRYRSLLIAGGYLLHNFAEMQRKAIILTQGRISEDDTSEGREGKTLFIESLGRYMLNKNPDEGKTFIYIPGKDLKNEDKHKWQDLELNTTCVLYDDPPPYIQFEDLYNLAERSFKVEKKRQENIYVKARIAITTNRPIDRDSGSSKARSCVIELDSIFSEHYSPSDKYNHRFFRDWKGDLADEWNKFSKFVLGTMLPEYFKANCNLLEPPSKNLYRNELLQKARRLSGSTEIVFWLDYLVKGDMETEPFFKLTETYHSKELYDKLLVEREQYRDEKKLKNNISKMIKTYFQKEGITFQSDRDGKGTWFKILGGLAEYKKFDGSMVKAYFSNGNKYNVDDIDNPKYLDEMVKDFNTKYGTRVSHDTFKVAVNEMIFTDPEIPFNN